MYSLLLYDYVDDIVERRAPFRDAHVALVHETHEHGVLLMAGTLAEPKASFAAIVDTACAAAAQLDDPDRTVHW